MADIYYYNGNYYLGGSQETAMLISPAPKKRGVRTEVVVLNMLYNLGKKLPPALKKQNQGYETFYMNRSDYRRLAVQMFYAVSDPNLLRPSLDVVTDFESYLESKTGKRVIPQLNKGHRWIEREVRQIIKQGIQPPKPLETMQKISATGLSAAVLA